MSIKSFMLSLTLLVLVVAQAAEARPPFFIRFIDVSERDGEQAVVADIVNPRNASVLLKAYVRAGSLQAVSLDMSDQQILQASQSLLVGPASRRKVEIPLSSFPEGGGQFELVFEQQPKYFASKQSLGMPETMTVTSYIVELKVVGTGAKRSVIIGDTQRQISQLETE